LCIYLKINHLSVARNVRNRTILGPEFQIGTEEYSPGIFHPPRTSSRLPETRLLRSRTSVLSLPIPLRHRFFSGRPAHFTHDRALPSTSSPPSRLFVVRVLRRPSSCFGSHRACGHSKHDPLRSRRHLLLQLLSFQNKTRVRKNV
jgi:hypothetical protein